MHTCYRLNINAAKHTFDLQIVLERFFPKMLALNRKKQTEVMTRES